MWLSHLTLLAWVHFIWSIFYYSRWPYFVISKFKGNKIHEKFETNEATKHFQLYFVLKIDAFEYLISQPMKHRPIHSMWLFCILFFHLSIFLNEANPIHAKRKSYTKSFHDLVGGSETDWSYDKLIWRLWIFSFHSYVAISLSWRTIFTKTFGQCILLYLF